MCPTSMIRGNRAPMKGGIGDEVRDRVGRDDGPTTKGRPSTWAPSQPPYVSPAPHTVQIIDNEGRVRSPRAILDLEERAGTPLIRPIRAPPSWTYLNHGTPPEHTLYHVDLARTSEICDMPILRVARPSRPPPVP